MKAYLARLLDESDKGADILGLAKLVCLLLVVIVVGVMAYKISGAPIKEAKDPALWLVMTLLAAVGVTGGFRELKDGMVQRAQVSVTPKTPTATPSPAAPVSAPTVTPTTTAMAKTTTATAPSIPTTATPKTTTATDTPTKPTGGTS